MGLRETLEAATRLDSELGSGEWTEDEHRARVERAMARFELDMIAPELAAWGLDVFERHAHLLDDDLLNRWQKITGGE